MGPPRLHVKDESGFAGVWREVHFEEWTSRGTPAQLRARHERRRVFLDELPAHRKVVTVSIVRSDAIQPLDAEQRSAVDEGIAQTALRAKGGAVMIDSTGFKAVIIRSLIATLTLMGGSKVPTKIFSDLDAMFTWVAPLLDADGGRPVTAQELTAAYLELVEIARSS